MDNFAYWIPSIYVVTDLLLALTSEVIVFQMNTEVLTTGFQYISSI